MRKRLLLLPALIAVALVLILFAPTLHDSIIPGKYEKSIVRNTQGAIEEQALSAAENANYTGIFHVERFAGSTEPNDYLNPGTYLAYTYANFIDTEVLAYYDIRFESLKGKPEPDVTEFSYEATAHSFDQMRIVCALSNSITALSPNGTTLFSNPEFTGPSWGMRLALANDSGFVEIQPEMLDLNFSNCFLVEMKLIYSETYAPVAAFISDVFHVVIVDESFKPLLLCTQSKNLIA